MTTLINLDNFQECRKGSEQELSHQMDGLESRELLKNDRLIDLIMLQQFDYLFTGWGAGWQT